jgi:4-diphosphocytidyl-2-C-methyl-D-erythritol kinase
MYFRTDDFKRIARPPAKLNLYLDVFGRRGDGFHELETLMVPIRLRDSLAISAIPAASSGEPGPLRLLVRQLTVGRSLDGQSPQVPLASDNLVIRALELLRLHSGCTLGADIELVKRIPAAAGLGGGSSDAAAALRLANDVWRLGWHRERLADLAGEIGSDVPFFMFGLAAVCRGRGELVETLPATKPLHFVLVKPPVELRTADVYREFDSLAAGPAKDRASELGSAVAALGNGRLAELARAMRNSLEAAAAVLTPWIERARAAFDKLGFIAHQLSGSGSVYFGLCGHAQHARRLAARLKLLRMGSVYVARSCP